MKKILFFLLITAVLFAVSCENAENKTTGTNASNPPEEITSVIEYPMGDANGDGAVDESDLDILNEYLFGEEIGMIVEHMDLDGDFCITDNDYKLLRAYLNGGEVNVSKPDFFSKPDTDITNDLEDRGVNALSEWNNNTNANIASRNPFDMISANGRVFVSGGNYQDNTGPVPMYYYSRYTSGKMLNLPTEQINRFYDCGDYIVALAVDPRSWMEGDVYFYSKAEDKWIVDGGVLDGSIHAYDLVCFNGEYFICGSSIIRTTEYPVEDANYLELSKANVYRVSGDLTPELTKEDYVDIKLINKNGEQITNESYLTTYEKDGQTYYTTMGVPRAYEFFTLNGELYVFYYNQYYKKYDEQYNYNGLYRYDEESEVFIFDETLNYEGLYPIMSDSSQDCEKIQHDFEYDGRYYFIREGLYATSDFKEYEELTIPNYENYKVRDYMIKNGKIYLLAGEKQDDGSYVNAVFETTDFENYRTLFHFSTELFARSFEYAEGVFYFGLGYIRDFQKHKVEYPDGSVEYFNIRDSVTGLLLENIPEDHADCGKILSYAYYATQE